MNRVLQPLITATIGKTTSGHAPHGGTRAQQRPSVDDHAPLGLFDAPGVTRYELHEDQAPGIFTSRADLAASLLTATDARFVRKAVAVTTSDGAPHAVPGIAAPGGIAPTH